MNVVLNKCSKCGGTKYEGNPWKCFGATFASCAQCKKCAIVLESSPEYEAYCQQLANEKAQAKHPTVTCPYCQSINTKKITNTSKAVHTAIFGIFAMSRNAKNYHCNGCGSDF